MHNMILTTESGSDVPQTTDCAVPVTDCFDFFRQTKRMPTTSAVNPREYAKIALEELGFPEEFVNSHEPDREAIMVFYTSGCSAPLLERLKERCREMGFQHVLESETGCAISCHGGPGAVGLAAFAKEKAR